MGGICSQTSAVDSSADLQVGDIIARSKQGPFDKVITSHPPLYDPPSNVPPLRMEQMAKDPEELDTTFSFDSEDQTDKLHADDKKKLARALSNKAKSVKSRTTEAARYGAAKVNEVGSLLGRAGTAGLGKAVEALDTLGSSMTNLNLGSGFASGATPKGNKIGILAFEVANTIVKGFNLKQSLSVENIRMLKEEILCSEGVQLLVSTDTDELLRIAAADKRDELKIFIGEVVRFGNRCRDPQWHHLDRFFKKLGDEVAISRQTREETETQMQNLMALAQYTAELYHGMHSLDRFEADYHRKLQEEDMLIDSERGDSLAILRNELKSQKKQVKILKKRSLWSKILEEVMENLVDIVYFLHQEIQDAFGDTGENTVMRMRPTKKGSSVKLGDAGLALHYANIINQIDSLASCPSSVLSSTRENLYQGLPPSIKANLRNRLRICPFNELTIPEIKIEMEKTLSWLAPLATNTTKAHHGFGWVGEWANTGSALDSKLTSHTEFILLQTLHHADQKLTEDYILELIVWLHYLVILARRNVSENKSPIKSSVRSPFQQKELHAPPEKANAVENGLCVCLSPELSLEDQEMLNDVKNKKFTPGISKSQEFDMKPKASNSSHRLSKSSSHSPSTSTESFLLTRFHATVTPINLDAFSMKALDVIDRVDDYSMSAYPCN